MRKDRRGEAGIEKVLFSGIPVGSPNLDRGAEVTATGVDVGWVSKGVVGESKGKCCAVVLGVCVIVAALTVGAVLLGNVLDSADEEMETIAAEGGSGL